MSTIGPGLHPVPPLASSVAGARNTEAGRKNERAGEAAARDARLARDSTAARMIEDIAGSGESADRDADGRETGVPQRTAGDVARSGEDSRRATAHRPPDAAGERGGSLDLDA